jgi:hypothetical protein
MQTPVEQLKCINDAMGDLLTAIDEFYGQPPSSDQTICIYNIMGRLERLQSRFPGAYSRLQEVRDALHEHGFEIQHELDEDARQRAKDEADYPF